MWCRCMYLWLRFAYTSMIVMDTKQQQEYGDCAEIFWQKPNMRAHFDQQWDRPSQGHLLATKYFADVANDPSIVPLHTMLTNDRRAASLKCVCARQYQYRFGVGRLVRELNLTLVENYYTPRVAAASVPADLSVVSWPARPMRGIQIGYRPKTNSCVATVCHFAQIPFVMMCVAYETIALSFTLVRRMYCSSPHSTELAHDTLDVPCRYDGLTPELFESLVVDLILFGANQIELIPGSFDDAPYSPHFALSHREMNTVMSTVLAKYVCWRGF